jgi:hypothetical protein
MIEILHRNESTLDEIELGIRRSIEKKSPITLKDLLNDLIKNDMT